MDPALAPPRHGRVSPYTHPSRPGAYAWFCVSAIGNAHTHAPGTNTNTNRYMYVRPPSIGALAWLQQPSLELALFTTAPDSNNGLQVFYTTEHDLLKDHELTQPGREETSSAQWESRHHLGYQSQWFIWDLHAARRAALAPARWFQRQQ